MEAQTRADAAASHDREGKILSTLLNSPDPEVKSHAVAGMLDWANPPKRKGGLAGWLGENEASPHMDAIRALVGHSMATDAAGAAPAAPVAQAAAPAGPVARAEPAAQAATAIGAPPPSDGAVASPTPSLFGQLRTPRRFGLPDLAATSAPAVAGADGTPGPAGATPAVAEAAPRASLPTAAATGPPPAGGPAGPSPAAVLGRATPAPLAATTARPNVFPDVGADDFQGTVRALTPSLGAEGAVRQALAERNARSLRGGLGIGHVFVETPDGQQHAAVFDARAVGPGGMLGQYLNADTGQVLVGAKPLQSTGSTSLGADREAIARELGYGPAAKINDPARMAHVNAVLLQRHGQLTKQQALQDANTMLPNASNQQKIDLADALFTGTSAPLPGTVAPLPSAGGAAAAPAAPSAVTPGQPPPAPGAAAPSAAAAASVGTGVKLPADLAGATRETGKPLPPSVALALGRSRATSGLLDRAIAALEPFKNQNRLEDTFALSQNYRKGVYDPVTTAATQLADLAGLQASASSQLTAGSSRALRYYVDRKQHVPRFPNLLQIDASGLTGAERMNRISQYITTIRGKGEEGGFDTPQQMYQKLVGARDNNNRFITETEGAANITKVGGAGTPPPSAGPQTYKDADGKWHIRQQP